jgi:NitT/TauT family transport system substrate-binding protein
MNMLKLSSWIGWLVVTVVFTTITTTSCTQQSPDTPVKPSSQLQSLTSATSDWVGFSSYYVAAKKGLFTENGLTVKDSAPLSAPEVFVAFMTRNADIAWVTTADAVQMIERDPSVKIVYVTDYSNGSDGIIGRNIKLPQDIKGKTIARENMLYEKVFLREYLKKAGLTEKDVQIKDMVAADASKAFVNKQVDAAVTYEPFLSKAANTGGGNVIFSTKDTNLIADVIVVREQLLKNRKSELQAYLKAVDKAIKLIKAEDPEALKITSAQMSISVDEVKSALKGIKLFDLESNKTIAFNKGNPTNIIGNLQLTTKGAADFKAITKSINPKSIYDTSLIE